jgi:hypothetical protein
MDGCWKNKNCSQRLKFRHKNNGSGRDAKEERGMGRGGEEV